FQMIEKHCPSAHKPISRNVEPHTIVSKLAQQSGKPIDKISSVSDVQEKIITECLINIVGPLGPILVNNHKEKKNLGFKEYIQTLTESMDASMREKLISSLKEKGVY
ncbi:MAG TPA: hypothetical protein VIY47_13030, partial [Ignavibacteriaceae bacterium]